MKKLAHILRELAHGIGHTASAMLNTVRFGGDMYTSTSARAHLDQAQPDWRRRRRIINALFFWQEDHCRSAWEADFNRAVEKVSRNLPSEYP
jgi:multidrug resistance efflux pump